jgi:hypothetical protein
MQVYPNDGPDEAMKKLASEHKFFTIPIQHQQPEVKDKLKNVTTNKYSMLGKGELYESVILKGVRYS